MLACGLELPRTWKGITMTSYSVIGTTEKVSVLATWQGTRSDRTVKVTTATREAAEDLASALATASEAAWFAAAWLDTWPVTRGFLRGLAQWARAGELQANRPQLDTSACRHHEVLSTYDAAETLTTHLPAALAELSHTQRLAVSEELDKDLDEIELTVGNLAQGLEPPDDSRGWQFAEVTRTWHYGLGAFLPEAGPTWATVYLDAATPLEKWAARGHLLRVEQLTAACRATGGRAHETIDPMQIGAHLVWGAGAETRIVDAGPQSRTPSSLSYYATKPMRIAQADRFGQSHDLGEVDPYDTDALVRLLGDWVLSVPSAGG